MSDCAATICITRTSRYPDRCRAYRILIDGREFARLMPGESAEIPVNPGRHSVVARVDWCGSPTLQLDVHSGEAVSLECASNLQGFRMLFASLYVQRRPDEYLQLVRVDASTATRTGP